MTSRGDNVGADQLRAFVERILRMKEEARAINDDIREIYAEAKGNGFDKTVLGQIVSYVEKRAKDPDTLAERSALFDLYLGAFDGVGTVNAIAHMHAHEVQPPRIVGAADMRDAYRDGAPISQDFAFENGEVYFAAFHALGRVKIGVSRKAVNRIADIAAAVGAEADILAIVPGNRQAEMAAHDHHAEWRIGKTEWFSLCDPLLASIATYTATHAHTHEEPATLPPPAAADPGEDIPSAQPEPSSPDLNSHPVANVGEEANGASAAASVDPASRGADDADRQQLAVPGFTGDAAVVSSQTRLDDASDEPARETTAAQSKRSSNGLPRHALCLQVDKCAGTWRAACHLCLKAAGQIAVEAGGVPVQHNGSIQ